jgi:hypothetical protein
MCHPEREVSSGEVKEAMAAFRLLRFAQDDTSLLTMTVACSR